MSALKKILLRSLLGFPLGVAIGATIQLVIVVLMRGKPFDESYSKLNYYISAYLATGFLGAAGAGLSVVYEIEKWSILKKLAVHASLLLIILLSIALLIGWLEISIIQIAVFIGIFVAIYVIIFIAMWMYYKKQIDVINKEI